MTPCKCGELVIYKSLDCKTFDPVKTEDVPEWVKDPDVLARMVDGEACQNKDELGSPWFTAKRVLTDEDESALMKAYARRQRRQHIRLLHEQPQEGSRVVH